MPSEPAPGRSRRVVLVAAVADNGVIGADGGIPWHIAEDFKHFKQVTADHVLVMGRSTFESIGRPLPGRPNIVITGSADWSAEGVQVARSLADALALATAHDRDVAVIGGARVYAEALEVADAQVLTEVHTTPRGDTHYPPFDHNQWRQVRREAGPGMDPPYEWVWLERIGRPGATGRES